MAVWMSNVDGGPIAALYKPARVAEENDADRVDLGRTDDVMQTCAKALPAGRSFRAHAHLPVARSTIGTQEAWVVIFGIVKVALFDVDDSFLADLLLVPGDCLVTFRGGHGMTVIEGALIYEFKNGPYMGREADKRWIDGGPE